MSRSALDQQYVTLGLGAEVFAVPVAHVREILDYVPPAPLPEGPPYLLGLTNVRGQGAPTLDLRVRLGLPKAEPDLATRILVLDVPLGSGNLTLGLVADRVIEVATFPAEMVEPPPEIGVPWRSDYIQGVVRRERDFVIIFDLPRLLTGQESALLEAAA